MDKKAVLSFTVSQFIALSVSVVAVLIFSLAVTLTDLGDVFITLTTYVIKLLSLFIGVFTFAAGKRGAVKGLLFGLVYAILSSVIFAIIAGGFEFDVRFFADIVYCVAVGAALGALAVNVKKP